jgi:hypothetical protein
MRRNKRRGQATLEGALVLLLFLGILIGILDVAQVLFVHQAFTERARNALRYAAVRPFNATEAQNLVLYNQTAAPDGNPGGYLGLTRSMVNVERRGAGTGDDRVVVTISGYPFEFFSFYIAGRATGKPIIASMPYEGS